METNNSIYIIQFFNSKWDNISLALNDKNDNADLVYFANEDDDVDYTQFV